MRIGVGTALGCIELSWHLAVLQFCCSKCAACVHLVDWEQLHYIKGSQ